MFGPTTISKSDHKIVCIESNGAKLTTVEEIKHEVFEHFKEIFKATNINRPQMQHFEFKQIGEEDYLRLIAEFSKEIKRAVWECESLKSPCTDRINFRGDKHSIRLNEYRLISQIGCMY